MQHARQHDAQLEDSPINPDWVRSGTPQARVSEWGRSTDGNTGTFVWSCTAGEFDWHFAVDEIVHIVEGEVRVTDAEGVTTLLSVGDSGFFPAGSVWRWEVPVYVRKHAVLVNPMPGSVRRALGAARRTKRAVVAAAQHKVAAASAGLVAAGGVGYAVMGDLSALGF